MNAEELSTVTNILKSHLPDGYRAFAFGSRATGLSVKPWSDLDLSLEGPGPLSLLTLAALDDAFDWAPLVWKVDLIDRATVDESFGNIIDQDKIALNI